METDPQNAPLDVYVAMTGFYVAMTGFRPNGMTALPAFWWRTLASAFQARRARGNLGVTMRIDAGTYHTMTIWRDEASMSSFVSSGAHQRAMRNFRALGSGKVFSYRCMDIPDWQTVHSLWSSHGRDV